jgi:hypothetical protein
MRRAVTLLAVLAACGGLQKASQDAGGLRPDVEAGTVRDSASADAPSDAGANQDVGADAGCPQDSEVCSWVVDRGGCLGPTEAGVWCDYLATPCIPAPFDCGGLGPFMGNPVTANACDAGATSCFWNWVGTVDDAVVDGLCAARAKAGVPVDCVQN